MLWTPMRRWPWELLCRWDDGRTALTEVQHTRRQFDSGICVVLPAAVQAGILQGEVDSLMVMEQWQASLMRALAQVQLKNDPKARAQVEEKFGIEEEGEKEEEQEGQGDEDESVAAPEAADAEQQR